MERLFEGDRNARMRLDAAPWSFDKAWRKVGKHAVWLGIAFASHPTDAERVRFFTEAAAAR